MAFADNPIINSPFEKPQWHFELDDEGQPTGKRLSGRRDSVQVVPVPAARRRGPRQRELALEEKTTSNTLVSAIRKDVDQWRDVAAQSVGCYAGDAASSAALARSVSRAQAILLSA